MVEPQELPSRNQNQQLILGNHNIQFGDIHGSLVDITLKYSQPQLESLPTPVPQLEPLPTPVSLLPKDFPYLVGRKEEINLAIASFESFQPLEFYSKPGLGKTVLIRHLAYHSQATAPFTDGIISFFEFHQSVSDLLQSFFEAFYKVPPNYIVKSTEICQSLKDKKALVILDNQELSKKEIEKLINAVPSFTFLIASSERCLWGEGKAQMLRGLASEEALKLIQQTLNCTFTPEEAFAAKSLCETLKGHPQEIIYALGKVQAEGCSLKELLHQDQASELSFIQQMLEPLTTRERFIIAVLAAFGGIALLAKHAAGMTNISDVEAIFKTLKQRNLVQFDGSRYRVSRTLVEALEKDPAWDLTLWKEKALKYFTDWAEQHQNDTTQILEESDAIIEVLQWGVETEHWVEVLKLVKLTESSFALGKQWGLWERVLQWGLKAARAIPDPAAEAWALHQLGSRALCLKEIAIASSCLRKSLKLRKALDDKPGIAVTRHNLKLISGIPFWVKCIIGVVPIALVILLVILLILDKPTAIGDSINTNEDEPKTFDANILLENDDGNLDSNNGSDVEDNFLTIKEIDDSQTKGEVTFNPNNNTITYNPNQKFEELAVGETATDTFQYVVGKRLFLIDIAIVTVNITGVTD